MKNLYILHLGIGKVGKEVVKQIALQKKEIKKKLKISLVYSKYFNSKNSEEEINNAIQQTALPFVLIDTTASDKTIPYIIKALKRGGFAVLANKKPLSSMQETFDLLHKLGRERLFYECVVGAGLPVVCLLKDLIMTGDEIVEIQGCFSGTLGFLFSQLNNGNSFSKAVLEAKKKGFTEPDPRDDLSGKDVARKALILARLIGQKIELKNIKLGALYPEEMHNLSQEDFLKNIRKLDIFYKEKTEKARRENKVLRFVAKVSYEKCSVGLLEVDGLSDIGSLTGQDNIIAIKTKRYFDNPLVIKGPGAGIGVTASGVFSDVLTIARMINGEYI